jgi:tryptophanyl-tRNA synthetase
MSKSNPSANSRINLLDDPELIRSKIMKATTDSEGIVKFDESRPGVYNLLEIYENLTQKSREEIEQHFEGKGYGDFKKEVAEVVVEALRPIQEKYRELMANPETIEKMLQEGANKIRPMAEETLQEVKTKVGLGTITSLSS